MPQEPKEKNFMREKIVKPPGDRQKIIRNFACLIIFAVIFGVVAAVSFVLSRPMFEEWLGKETEPVKIPITIERDDEPGPPVTPMETMEPTTEEATSPPELAAEDVESLVNEAMETYEWTKGDVEKINQVFRKIGVESDKGIVTVSPVKTQVDWFDNPVESAGQYAGIILAENENEVVILTGIASLEGADSLRVIFGDGSTAPCSVKQRDTVAKMAALSVPCSELSDSTKNWIEAIALGNSYSMRTGDILIAVGSPAGRVHSVKQGLVSYVAKGVQVADGQTRVLYTDMDCDVEKGTFLLNVNGHLVGWVRDRYQTEEIGYVTIASCISE